MVRACQDFGMLMRLQNRIAPRSRRRSTVPGQHLADGDPSNHVSPGTSRTCWSPSAPPHLGANDRHGCV